MKYLLINERNSAASSSSFDSNGRALRRRTRSDTVTGSLVSPIGSTMARGRVTQATALLLMLTMTMSVFVLSAYTTSTTAAAAAPGMTAPTLAELQKLIASDGGERDLLGSSVAISGDTAIVGAPSDDIGQNENQGSAYFFGRSGINWVLQQKITASDGAGNHFFGISAAISGNTAVIGARGPNMLQGAAYVFVRSGTTWIQQQKISSSDGAPFDSFGLSVAINGNTIICGAENADIGSNADQGAAYVFVRSGTTWAEQQKLTANDGSAGNQFGFSVGISGTTIVVGDDDNNPANPGGAYVFVRSGATWSLQQKLTANDGVAGDGFGYSVAINGDTIMVGATDDDIGANLDQGSAYVFVRSSATWSQQQKLVASDGAAFDGFGGAVALSGGTALAGAEFHRDGGTAYVFVLSGTTWSQQQKLTASDAALHDLFGGAVAIDNGAAIIGARWTNNAQNFDQGAAYVFAVYDFCVRDDTLNRFLLFNPVTGLYQFFDCSKNITSTGVGTLTINSCKMRFNGSGPNNNVSALVNPCTRRGDASIVVTRPGGIVPSSQTYTIGDSDITNNTGICR